MNDLRRPPNDKELYELLREFLSHDDTMAYCILEGDKDPIRSLEDFEDVYDVGMLIRWMGNIVTLAGAFLFSVFNKWRNESVAEGGIPNTLYLKRMLSGVEDAKGDLRQKSSAAFRVLRVLDGLYDIFEMNFFVIKSIIINSQLEAGFNSRHGKRCGLCRMLGFPHEESFLVTCDHDDSDAKFAKEGQNLSKAFSFINLLRSDPIGETNIDNDDVYKPGDIKLAFVDVFHTLEFMKRVKLKLDDEGKVVFCETKSDGKSVDIPSEGVVRVFARNKENKRLGIYKSADGGFSALKAVKAEFCLLEKIEYILNEKKDLNAVILFAYKLFDGSGSVAVYFAEGGGSGPVGYEISVDCDESAADRFKRISGYLPGTRSATSFFRGMVSSHYRYHNTLAPSIVDAIDQYDYVEAKLRILRKFVKPDPIPFKESFEPVFKTLEQVLKDRQDEKVDISVLDSWGDKVEALCKYIIDNENQYKRIIDWDTLIARILVYEGPNEILRTVLLPDKECWGGIDIVDVEKMCKAIIAGLEMRYIDDIFEADNVLDLQRDYVKELRRKIRKYRELFPDAYAKKMECMAVAQTYINAIVKTLTKLKEEDGAVFDAVGNKFAENSIMDMLQVLDDAANNRKEKYSSWAERAFKQTVLAFLAFYAGIKASCQTRVSYEFEKSAKILSEEEVKEKKNKMDAEFLDGVKKKAEELYERFYGKRAVEDMLKALWEFAENDKDEKYYQAMLARSPIDKMRLRKIFTVDGHDMVVFFRSGKEPLPFPEARESGVLVNYLRKIVGFLYGEAILEDESEKTIEPDKSNYTLYKEYVKRVVYPQIVTFAKRRVDGDKNDCLLMDHNGAFAEWHDGEVKILTEFQYEINHAYYVISNLNYIETEWWVDPILVSCYNFDNKLREALKEE